jgi:MFS family permease
MRMSSSAGERLIVNGGTTTMTSRAIRRTYYTLLTGNTLAASLIWGINTIFLLDAGLTNFQAFAANAFFAAGMLVFEVPTGVVADVWGRRASFLLGTVTLAVTTAAYVLLWQAHGPFLLWALISLLLGLGFTFFSGATEAWLVDALRATAFDGPLESVLARGQMIGGVAMLGGSVAGGYLAQVTNLGIPFVLRAVILAAMFAVAFRLMHDVGFSPRRDSRPLSEMRRIASSSVDYGLRVPSVRWLMLSAPFTGGVSIYVFYALQPHLLDLYGNDHAYGIAGLAAAIVAGAQILGGMAATGIRRLFRRRTSALIMAEAVSALSLVLVGLTQSFWIVIGLIVVWGLLFSAAMPIRQAYINDQIPSEQRATILSFDSLMASSGGVVAQPALGRAADVWGYPASYVMSGGLAALALPFLYRARQQQVPADTPGAVAPADADEIDITSVDTAPADAAPLDVAA